jgi:hypothetical protein
VIALTALGVSGAQARWYRSFEDAIEHVLLLLRLVWRLASMLAIAQNLGLDPQQIGLDGRGAAQTPQQRCQPEHQFALDGSLGIIVRDDRRFESAVVIDIVSAHNPWRTAFCRDRRLPSSVLGPVLLSALRRLASICRNDVMGWSIHRHGWRPSSPHPC